MGCNSKTCARHSDVCKGCRKLSIPEKCFLIETFRFIYSISKFPLLRKLKASTPYTIPSRIPFRNKYKRISMSLLALALRHHSVVHFYLFPAYLTSVLAARVLPRHVWPLGGISWAPQSDYLKRSIPKPLSKKPYKTKRSARKRQPPWLF